MLLDYVAERGEPFAEFASYILARLSEDSPNLLPHPQYPYPVRLDSQEYRRLEETAGLKS